jgi:tetratricopeptide (TPR) repeat protein
MDRWKEAEEDARAAFESEAAPPESGQVLAQILRVLDRREEAIAALEKVRAEGGISGRDLWLLGRMYMEDERLADARKVLEDALGAEPGLMVVANDLAFVLAETGENLERALALATQARSALPESPAVADTLGWVYYRRGLMEPAAAEFRAGLALADEDVPERLRADLHYHLALVLLEQGRTDEALRTVEQALALVPDHEEAQAMQARIVARASESGG